ncbi:MAG: hypothetical protein ABFD50_21305 [Smithella sp.]
MKKNFNGFVLMELIIVLLIVILILGLSTFFFSGFLPRAKFNATGREISAMIRHTRALARLNMESRTFDIDLDNKTYGTNQSPIKSIPKEVSVKVIDPFSGEVNHGKYSIVFNPAGGVAGGTIILFHGKSILQIEMDPITGAVLARGG